MIDTKEPHSALQWQDWGERNHCPIEAIRRAQEQARREAIEQCANILYEDGLKIRDMNTVGFTKNKKHILRSIDAEKIIGTVLCCSEKIRALLEKK